MIPRTAAQTLHRLAKGFPILAITEAASAPIIVFGGEGSFERESCRVLGWREFTETQCQGQQA